MIYGFKIPLRNLTAQIQNACHLSPLLLLALPAISSLREITIFLLPCPQTLAFSHYFLSNFITKLKFLLAAAKSTHLWWSLMKMCSQKWQKSNASVRIVVIFLVFFIISVNQISAQQQQQSDNPGSKPLLAQVLYSSFSNFTSLFDPAVTNNLKFCIDDV